MNYFISIKVISQECKYYFRIYVLVINFAKEKPIEIKKDSYVAKFKLLFKFY